MKLGVALQVMQTSELRITLLASIRFLVAVCEEMALEIVVSGELGRTVRATMLLRRLTYSRIGQT